MPGGNYSSAVDQPMAQRSENLRSEKVEGTQVKDILLDTGCSTTLVCKDLVPEDSLLAGKAVATYKMYTW